MNILFSPYMKYFARMLSLWKNSLQFLFLFLFTLQSISFPSIAQAFEYYDLDTGWLNNDQNARFYQNFVVDWNVGIGTANPAYKLDVNGKWSFQSIRIASWAASDYILTSDASGNASWKNPTQWQWFYLPLWNTADFDPACYYQVRFRENGTGTYLENLYGTGNVWINAQRVTAKYLSLLFINGAPQLSYGVPSTSKWLYGYRSSDTGLFVPMPEYPIQEMRSLCSIYTGTGMDESDPKIWVNILNYIPKWNGTNLSSSSLFESGWLLGLGLSTPSYRLDVAGTGAFYGLRIASGATNNYILASDASGNARWVSTGSLIGSTIETDPLWTAQKTFYATSTGSNASGTWGINITGNASTSTIATTATNALQLGWVWAASYALLASPGLTGTPTAPTAPSATNTTQLATTAFVKNQGYLTAYTETDPVWLAQKSGYVTVAGLWATWIWWIDIAGNADTATFASGAPWSGIIGKPTTVAGYGISDMASQSVNYATTAWSTTFATIASGVTWTWVIGRPTAVSAFTNDAGYLTSISETDPLWTAQKTFYATSTGSNASGTWGINITGNATTATTATTASTASAVNFNGWLTTTSSPTFSWLTISNDLTVVGKVITDTLVNRTVSQLTVSGSIFPYASSSQKDLGATGNRWANLWLSGNADVTGSVTAWSFIGNLTGNASTVTNGVYTNGTYADPAWITSLAKSKVGLANVDNTSDANKPVSTAAQTALNLKSNIASPTFTGDPVAPTPLTADNDTSIATTAFVKAQSYLTSYTETDPSVYAWAKSATKPSYAFTEVTGSVTDAQVPDTITVNNATNASFATIASGVTWTWVIGRPTAVSAFTNDAGYLTSISETDPLWTAQKTFYATSTGSNASGTWGINITGNAATVTNGVYTNGTYADPAWITSLSKSKVGLANVDNTSDANKPVSTAGQTALGLKADLASPGLTGTPTAPTATPGTNTTQLATTAFVKTEVDTGIAGLSWKNAVKAATTANITLSAPQTIDGYSVIAGDRVLVKNQSTPSQNGIYIVAAWAWTRATDADTASEIDQSAVYVKEGTTNKTSGWVLATQGAITLGSTALAYAQFSWNGSYTAWNGISIVGNSIAQTSVGTAWTYTKVTTDAQGNVTLWTTLSASDIPSLDWSKITTGNVPWSRLSSIPTTVAGYWIADLGSYAPTLTGSWASGTWGINITGNASTVTNGVYTSGTYADPLWITSLAKSKVGLANVDNTSDANKPVSTAQQTALNLKSNIASPTFTGDPVAPTPLTADNDTSIATTAYVKAQWFMSSGSETDPVWNSDKASYALLASPSLTWDPTAPTPGTSDSDTSIATTAYVKAQGFVVGGTGWAETDPEVGANTINYLSKWNGTALVAGQVYDTGTGIGIWTTSPWQKLDVSGGSIRTTNQFISTLATGTAPLSVSSTTVNTNLNADYLDGYSYNNLPYLTSYTETDPTIFAWAKAATKPWYGFTEITGTVTDAQVPDTITVNNAATATALQTSRTINGVGFNGTSNITLPTVNTTGDQTIAGNKTFTGDLTVVGKVITDTLVNRTVSQLTVSGSIFPYASSSQKDLGATGNRWANLWLSGNADVTGSVTAWSFIGNLTGNASTVTNGVYTNGTYADPAWITSLAKSKVGLANVDNTSDANKPVSTAAQTALNLKSNIASPTFTGDPIAPTPLTADNDTSIATTAFVKNQGYLTSISETDPVWTAQKTYYATNTGSNASGTWGISITGNAATVTNGVYTNGTYADPAWITSLAKSKVGLANVDNTSDANKPVSTAAQTALNLKSNIASPTFTGDPIAPTPLTADNDTSIATTAFVKAQSYLTSYTETDPTIFAWAKAATKPWYGFTEITGTVTDAQVPDTITVNNATNATFATTASGVAWTWVTGRPTAVSAFTNDAGYLTSISETDPSVYAWAKSATKPSYGFAEVTGSVTDAQVPDTITVNTATNASQLGWVWAASYALLAAPTFTGDAKAVTPLTADNDTSIATTAFVKAQSYLTSYTETDPTIFAWAKAATKPWYGFTEITGTVTDAQVPDTITVNNAATATALQTSRTINGVGFNGTSNITLPTVNTTGDQTIAGNKTFTGDLTVVGKVITDTLVNRTVSQLTVSGSIFPYATSSQKDLGATGNRWANLWLSGNAYVTGSVISTAGFVGNLTGNASTATTATNSNQLGWVAAASYALLAAPTFTGDAKAVTQATGDNDTSIATTAFVKNQSYLTSFTESDPTIYAWAKASVKPSYAFTEISGVLTDAQIPDNITVTTVATATNADTVDSLHAASFLRKDTTESLGSGIGLWFSGSTALYGIWVGWAVNNKNSIAVDTLESGTGTNELEIAYYNAANIRLNNGGWYTYNATSMRSPIFYDQNNTAYYGDFASTSVTNIIQSNGYLSRGAHASGYLAWSYNNIGANDSKSNPIYTIGTAYAPTDSALSNMYGIGYAHANFWWAGKWTGWGLYTAEAWVISNTIWESGIWTKGSITASGQVTSPQFNGSLSGNALTATNSNQLGWVAAASYALLASPTFTGTPTLPTGSIGVTQTAGNSTTALATTAFVTTADNLKANLASPALTGDPVAPTPLTADNDTSIATTAYVKAQGFISSYTETDPEVGANTTNYVSKWNGSALVATQIFDNGTNVGIGTGASAYKLDVAGTGAFYGLRITSGATNNYILASDWSGNARWVSTGSIIWSIAETDPVWTAQKTFYATSTGSNASGTWGINITGNAATATALQTSRTINGIGFNGTSNITLPTVNTTGDQTIGGNKTFTGDITVVGKVITDTLVNRTVAQLTVSGSIFPYATSSQKDLGANWNRWNNLYLAQNAYVTGSVTSTAGFVGNLTGNASTATTATNSNQLGWVAAASYALLASPTFTGTPTLPTGSIGVTQTAGNSTTALATTAFVTTADNLKANIASPSFTGDPIAPTPLTADNDTSIATTAYVKAQGFISSYTETDPEVGANTTNYVSKWNGSALVATQIFDNGTNVGIGTGASAYKLDVAGTGAFYGLRITSGATNNYILASDWSGNARWVSTGSLITALTSELDPKVGSLSQNNLPKWSGSTLVNSAIYESGGYLGIGTASPSERLHISGNVQADSFLFTSDRRLKTDIVRLNASLDKINKLGGYTFVFKSTGKADIWVIAQEVETVFPELVKTDKITWFKSVEYGNLVAPLIEAVKELTQKMNDMYAKHLSQEAKIQSLEKKLRDLESRLDRLER
jgi:hypothetical protein